MVAIRRIAFSVCVGLVAACAGSVHPVSPTDLIGGGPPASRVTVRVKQALEVSAPFSVVYVLPVGEYRPVYADDHGVYFASPSGVVERASGKAQTLPGGLHLPNAGGRYYSFPSMYIEVSKGKPETLPLPEELLTSYGENVVFAVDGVEQRP